MSSFQGRVAPIMESQMNKSETEMEARIILWFIGIRVSKNLGSLPGVPMIRTIVV